VQALVTALQDSGTAASDLRFGCVRGVCGSGDWGRLGYMIGARVCVGCMRGLATPQVIIAGRVINDSMPAHVTGMMIKGFKEEIRYICDAIKEVQIYIRWIRDT